MPYRFKPCATAYLGRSQWQARSPPPVYSSLPPFFSGFYPSHFIPQFFHFRRAFPFFEVLILGENIHLQALFEAAFKNTDAAITRLLAPVRNARRDKPATVMQLVKRNLVTGPFLHRQGQSPNLTSDLIKEVEAVDTEAFLENPFSSGRTLLKEHIFVGGRWEPIYEFMTSNEFNHITPWQESGAVGLVKFVQSQFKGGFLCDSIGPGKSLIALVAALELRKGLLPNCGFILVVCRAGCVLQWAEEIRRHFKLVKMG
ncbi:hypothetical protein ACHAPQ_007433 [Fusarium lateritium]